MAAYAGDSFQAFWAELGCAERKHMQEAEFPAGYALIPKDKPLERADQRQECV
jgi:hypothetical protein